jgi:ribonucleotide monophosphatase NagD (HAD superfamily)
MTDYKHEIEDKNKAIVEILKNLQIATVQNYIAAQEDGSELASDLLPDAWHERLYEATTALTHLINKARIKEHVYVLEQIAEHGSYTADQAQDRIKELEK